MKKLFPILGIVALMLGMVALIAPMAKAAAPQGSMTSTALTVDIGQLKAINTITITDHTTAEITAANDIKIQIPAGVNAVWDVSDTTATIGGTAAAKVSTTVSYADSTTLVLNVTENFADSEDVTIAGLSLIGHTGASVAAELEWAIDGVTFRAGDATTQVTVADGAEDTLTSATVVPYDPVKSATSNYTVNFTVPATGVIPKNGKITLTFPAGFDITGAAISSATGIDGTFTATDAGQVLTIARQNDGTNATAGAKVLSLTGVVNHATAADTYTVAVATTTTDDEALASATSSTFEILDAPAAIDNLTCEPSGQAGAIWLRWTVPAGASTTYTAKRALAAMTNDGEFNAGTTITQSWAIGTKATAKQELVTGLNPNTRYYFAVKSGGVGPTTSAISTPAATTCLAPASAPVSADTTVPNTQITTPAAGSTVQAGQALKITGTALDTGGSSVQKVEVSLDGGINWNIADVTSIDESNVIWEYTWANAQAGTVNIKARATDWTDNVEDTPADITVTVSTTATSTPTTPTTPGEQATVAELQTQLQNLRVQLLNLLMQLVAQLQAQLSALQ